jgi:hypothetical protein
MNDRDAELDAWVARFRESKTFGRGSCSTVDECMTDAELREALEPYTTFSDAWALMVEVEHIHWERSGLDWNPDPTEVY